jgi:hypothetical protein
VTVHQTYRDSSFPASRRRLSMPGNTVLVLGDQLDRGSAAFDGFDRARDSVWMAEVAEESTHVWTHKARIAVFLAAMRHFRDALRADRVDVDYTELAPPAGTKQSPGATEPATLAAALLASLARAERQQRRPERLIVVEPGEWRVQESLVAAAARAGVPLEIRPDRLFSRRATSSRPTRGAASNCGWSTSTGRCGRNSPCSWRATSPPAAGGISTRKTAGRFRRPARENCRSRSASSPTRSPAA